MVTQNIPFTDSNYTHLQDANELKIVCQICKWKVCSHTGLVELQEMSLASYSKSRGRKVKEGQWQSGLSAVWDHSSELTEKPL